jgi:hypothetical protein
VRQELGSVAGNAGAKVTYGVSEAGTARFTVARVFQQRGSHRRNARLPGSFSHGAVRGRNMLRFTGRLNGRPLGAGRYTLAIKFVDTTGDRARAKHASFQIMR